MNSKNILNQILLWISLITIALSYTLAWSCARNGFAMPITPSEVAGVWYEISRFPMSEVPACVQVTVPTAPTNDSYSLQLAYVNNVNKGWQPTNETLVFPWNEAKAGIFNLFYSNQEHNVTIKFKYMGSLKNYALVCGYMNIATSFSTFRILSRNKLVNETVKTEISAVAQQLNMTLPELTWVQQDGRCNGCNNLSLLDVKILILFYLCQIFLKQILHYFS